MRNSDIGQQQDCRYNGTCRSWGRRARIRSASALPLLAGLLFLLAQSSIGQDFAIRRLVDTTTQVPNTEGSTFGGSVPFAQPVVRGERLLFRGTAIDPATGFSSSGLYEMRDQSLKVIIDGNTQVPDSTSSFSYFGGLDMDEDTIVFSGGDFFFNQLGVYRIANAGLEVIADTSTSIPDQGPTRFRSFGDVTVHGDVVLFGGGVSQITLAGQEDGIYAYEDGVLRTVVDAGTPVPGGQETFDVVGEVDLDAFGFAFRKPRFGASFDEALFYDSGFGIETIADQNTPIPEQTGVFENFRAMAYHRGDTAFVGVNERGRGGVYLHRNGGLERVADTTTIVSDGFGIFFRLAFFSNRVAFSGDHVVFMASRAAGPNALYVTVDGAVRRIAKVGEVLDGDIIKRMDLSPAGADADRVVFHVAFESERQGLYEVRLPFFRDGFESGDTAAWTETVMAPRLDRRD